MDFQSSQHKNALYVVFYGGCTAAESATHAFACAMNRMDWIAARRALPRDRKFTFGQKHKGEFFSDVLLDDPGYEECELDIESQDLHRAAKKLQGFIEYARAVRTFAAWVWAYKEGMADALLKEANPLVLVLAFASAYWQDVPDSP